MKKYSITQKGSVMIEALAMLGLIAMVTPVLYRKAADRTQELQDINIASQLRMMSEAVDAYITDNYATMSGICEGNDCGQAVTGGIHYSGIQEYLPEGFAFNSTTLFDGFEIGINKKVINDSSGGVHNLFTSAVVAKLRNDMQQSRAAKIATMIGANGGIVSGTGFNGTQGVWNASAANFGFDWEDSPVKNNSLVAISSSLGSEEEEDDSSNYLYRTPQSDIEKNTMNTTLYMAGNNIASVNKLIVNGYSAFTAASALVEGTGVVTIGGTSGGNLLVTGMMKVNELFSPNGTITTLSSTTATIDNVIVSGVAASKITAIEGTIDTFSSTTATIDNVIVSGVAASQITTTKITATTGTITDLSNLTARSGTIDTLSSTSGTIKYVTASNVTASQITVSGTAFFKVNTFGIGTTAATSYNQSGNMVVINDTESFFGRGYNTNSGKGLIADANGVWLTNYKTTSGTTINTTMLQNDAGWHFGTGSSSNSITSYERATGEIDAKNPKGVYIDRNGVIELATPGTGEGFSKGFIRARRLVSDVKYNDPYKGDETRDDGIYTYYQVNPAYTSIMNDIRLASRGGARLSDILPDYINKGIYVADSTVSETNFKWEEVTTVTGFDGLGQCDVSNPGCMVSPFLGAIYFPQCPYGYDYALTIEPFRFKVAQTYMIEDIAALTGSAVAAVKELNSGDDTSFNNTFKKLVTVSGDLEVPASLTVAGTGATGYIKLPRLLQTNTWLNTTLQELNDGWGVVMGFMYLLNSPDNGEYTNIAREAEVIGSTNFDLQVAWNMFPVYNQELAAVVKVYCFFNRDRTEDGHITDEDWLEQVYKYDQLGDPKTGYTRDDAWVRAVTDPSLSTGVSVETTW